MDSSLRLWESLRTDVRQADQVLDQQITQLEDLARISEENVLVHANSSSTNNKKNSSSSSNRGAPAKPTATRTLPEAQRQFDELRNNIEGNLQHYEKQLQAMADAGTGSLTATKHTERFHGLLQEKRRTVQRLTNDFRRRREQLELLPSIAVDLKNYEDEAGVRLLMDEQNSIRHTHARVNNIIEQATSTQARLQNQRERFLHMGDRLVQIAERIPVIQNVLRRIDARRRREVVILGSVLAIFIFLTVIFL